MDFAGQEACFVDGGVGIVCNIQEGVAATADSADALGVGIFCLVVSKLRQGLFQLVTITVNKTQNTEKFLSETG